jgi:hypothetical protein
MRKLLRSLAWVLGLLGLIVGAFVIWGVTPARPMPEALVALKSDSQVTVESGEWLAFYPMNSQPDTGFIIYPGGHVDYRAYAPIARAIADEGTLVILIPMPLSLAVLNAGAAEDVLAAYPDIQHWAIGGHSLGGVMAANYAFLNPTHVDGLVLWASYPTTSNDASDFNLAVLSISASLDGLSTPEKIKASVPLLPPSTSWITIEGGNHGQFGWYGLQSGDNLATITRQEQQEQIVQATVEFLDSLK